MIHILTRTIFLIVSLSLPGCIIGSAVEIAAETVEAGVEITGAAVGAAVDVVIPDKNDEDEG